MAGTGAPSVRIGPRPDLTFRQADDALGEQQPHLVRRDHITGLKAVDPAKPRPTQTPGVSPRPV
jgi:hypothetical protein